MSSRDSILSAIRKATAANGGGDPEAVSQRLAAHPRGVMPVLPRQDAVAQFAEKALMAAATVARTSRAAAPEAVATWLREQNLPKAVRMGADERLAAIDWQSAGLETSHGPSDGGDLNGLSHALAGVAETGTLVLTSGPANPTTLNFLPENHIVLVSAADIAANYEEVWSKLRFERGAAGMPRIINMVTGPSRSADIEQTLILGAHGPVRLHILVVDD